MNSSFDAISALIDDHAPCLFVEDSECFGELTMSNLPQSGMLGKWSPRSSDSGETEHDDKTTDSLSLSLPAAGSASLSEPLFGAASSAWHLLPLDELDLFSHCAPPSRSRLLESLPAANMDSSFYSAERDSLSLGGSSGHYPPRGVAPQRAFSAPQSFAPQHCGPRGGFAPAAFHGEQRQQWAGRAPFAPQSQSHSHSRSVHPQHSVAQRFAHTQSPPAPSAMPHGHPFPSNATDAQSSQFSPYGHFAGAASPSLSAMQGRIFQVQFKCATRYFTLSSQAPPSIAAGDFVVVEADRGEDVGVVADVVPMKTFIERRIYSRPAADEDNDHVIGRILRLATPAERQLLPEKYRDEELALQLCRELAHGTYRLLLQIHETEYQFDRHKLTIYYSSDARVDFREFVHDLFSAYKARIWMKKLNPAKPVRVEQWAVMSLATGLQFSPERSTAAR